MAFLAYRFLPAAALVALVFWRPLRALPPAGWRAGLVMGVFLTAGYVFQTLGLEHTTRLERRLHHRPVRRPDAAVRRARLRARRSGRPRGRAALLSALGLLLLSGAGGDLNLRGDGVVFLCACAFAVHILRHGAGGRALRRRRAGRRPARRLRPRLPRRRRGRRRARDAARRHRLERAARHLAGRERARLPRPELRAAARLAGAHGADPGRRAGVRRALRLPAPGRAAVGARAGRAPP